MTPQNQAAWLTEANTPLKVRDAPLPIAGPGEIVVKNAAVAINPLDVHMLDLGVFVQQWPAVFGCDVAGEVYEVGADVTRFKKGDRVIGYVNSFRFSNRETLANIAPQAYCQPHLWSTPRWSIRSIHSRSSQ